MTFHKNTDFDFLTPLKNRPGLTPLHKVKGEIKERIAAMENRNGKTHLIPILLTAVLLLTGSYYLMGIIMKNQPSHDAGEPTHQVPQKEDAGEELEESPIKVAPLVLTDEESEAYASFSENLDQEILRSLSPMSIAKIYVQAILDEKDEVRYELYTDRPDYIMWTKEEDEQFPKQDKGNRRLTEEAYNHLAEGEFVETGEDEGYIKYYRSKDPDSMMGFNLIRNENGIWQVAFMPIQ
ncbi:conserved hypothetical protein [Bacillus sp. 349Y]|nr:conserved hypothetical protein [Bacillus sp. 349Y]